MNKNPIHLFPTEVMEWQLMVEAILGNAPVKNLTKEEVSTTMRLMEIEMVLANPKFEKLTVDVFKNDSRMSRWIDTDRFLAQLVEADQQDIVLCSGSCIYRFGGTKYHWRKIGRTCPITATASRINECYGGYYGKGWVIAPHIKTLIKWIKARVEVMEAFKLMLELHYKFN